jgi:hypothetical protein
MGRIGGGDGGLGADARYAVIAALPARHSNERFGWNSISFGGQIGRDRETLETPAGSMVGGASARSTHATRGCPTIFAGSSMTQVLPELDSGDTYSFGSTGTLATQTQTVRRPTSSWR